MSRLWTDGDWTTASHVGGPSYSSPLPGTTDPLILRQDCMILAASYSALAISTAHPTETTYKLVQETDRQDQGGGVVKWTRVYAKVPAAWTEYSELAYNFIGYMGVFGINVETATGRERFTKIVPMKICHDYWIANGTSQTDPIAGGTGVTITTAGNIPRIQGTLYTEAGYPTLLTDYLKDSPPFVTASAPDRTAYEAYISTDAATATSYSIVVETSKLDRWMGEIWHRTTTYVKAL